LGGRFLRLHLVGDHRLLAQTSSGRFWLLDAETGTTLYDRQTALAPWPWPPVVLAERYVALAEDPGTVVLFDPTNGKEQTRPVSGPSTTLSGVPPRLATAGDTLTVAQVRNHGTTLQCFDARTGVARWEEERRVGRTPPDDLAADASAVYVVCGCELSAFALRDGKPLWQTLLLGPDAGWRVLTCRGGLLAYPADFGFRLTLGWLPGRLSLSALPSRPSSPRFAVHIIDPESGQLVQRINLSRAAAQVGTSPGGAWTPSLRVTRP